MDVTVLVIVLCLGEISINACTQNNMPDKPGIEILCLIKLIFY